MRFLHNIDFGIRVEAILEKGINFWEAVVGIEGSFSRWVSKEFGF